LRLRWDDEGALWRRENEGTLRRHEGERRREDEGTLRRREEEGCVRRRRISMKEVQVVLRRKSTCLWRREGRKFSLLGLSCVAADPQPWHPRHRLTLRHIP